METNRADSPQGQSAFPAAHGIAYRPEIDGLRAITVGSVILYHAGIWPFTGGYVGVDIFFVISGYLISSIILGDLARDKFSFANFYERRIRRIFPPLFLVLAVSTIAALIVLTPKELRDFGQALLSTTLFASNIYFRLKTNYFNNDVDENPLINMWSLSVEEQFYLFFPIVLIVLHRWKVMKLEHVLIAGFVLSLGWCLYREGGDAVANFFLTPSRAWELIAGAMVAVYRARWIERFGAGTAHRVPFAVELAGAAMMLAPIFLLTKDSSFPGIATVPVVVGTALVILTSAPGSLVGRMLATGPMVGIGLVSYSAYLWHQPLFAFAHALQQGAFDAPLVALLIGTTFLLAWLSWRYVERPFRIAPKGAYRKVFGVALALTLLFAGIGAAMHLSRGFPQRFGRERVALEITASRSPLRDACRTEGRNYRAPARACVYPNGAAASWAVLGDSHAIEIGYALAETLKPRREALVHLTFSGCQPALAFLSPNPGCSSWTGEALRFLEGQPDVRNVVVVYRHSFYLYGDQRGRFPEVPDSAPVWSGSGSPTAAREAYWRSFEAIIRRLRAAGKRVFVVAPVPELPAHAERFFYGRLSLNAVPGPGYYRQRSGSIVDRLRAIPGITLIEPVDALCDTNRCYAVRDGMALYFDDNHLSMPGARLVISHARGVGKLP